MFTELIPFNESLVAGVDVLFKPGQVTIYNKVSFKDELCGDVEQKHSSYWEDQISFCLSTPKTRGNAQLKDLCFQLIDYIEKNKPLDLEQLVATKEYIEIEQQLKAGCVDVVHNPYKESLELSTKTMPMPFVNKAIYDQRIYVLNVTTCFSTPDDMFSTYSVPVDRMTLVGVQVDGVKVNSGVSIYNHFSHENELLYLINNTYVLSIYLDTESNQWKTSIKSHLLNKECFISKEDRDNYIEGIILNLTRCMNEV